MVLADRLEIFIITYNRVNSLKHTLNELLNTSSPCNKCLITVLDNNSSDDTNNFMKKIIKDNNNVKYIRNKKNVGLSGNYCKAIELIEKDYYWILADDDSYDWSSWNEVEKNIEDNVDIIITTNIVPRILGNSKASAVLASGWLPSCIIRSRGITDDVVAYAYNEIPTIYPQISVTCNIINKGLVKDIYVVKNDIVKYGNTKEDTSIKDFDNYDFNRINSSGNVLHPRLRFNEYYSNLILACSNIKDKKIYNEILFWLLSSKDHHINIHQVWQNILTNKCSCIMLINAFSVLPFKYKAKFLINFIPSLFSMFKKKRKEKRKLKKKMKERNK